MDQERQDFEQRNAAQRPPAKRRKAQERGSAGQQRPAARAQASSAKRSANAKSAPRTKSAQATKGSATKGAGSAQGAKRSAGASRSRGAQVASETRSARSAARGKGTSGAKGASQARRQQRPSAKRPARKPSSQQQAQGKTGARGPMDVVRPWIPLASLVVAGLLVVLGIVRIVSCVRAGGSDAGTEVTQREGAPAFTIPAWGDAPRALLLDGGRTTATGTGRMSFAAVGDNLANENILGLADGWGGSGTGDGVYDFAPLYDQIKEELSLFDVTFINQETTLGGLEVGDYSGYPSYNTPDSMADAVVGTGFRVINTNTNHTYDYWTSAIEHSQQVWQGYDQVVTIGSYQDEADRNTIRVVECNGVRVAFLSYCYGQNGYEQADLPNDYYAVPFSEEALAADVQAARKVAHGVVVYLHMGDEYVHQPSETEVAWAQACADNNVDLMIASHAHVIQPMVELTRADGKTMWAVYGMGDFVSGYEDYPETVLSGMFSCTFVYNAGGVTVEDPVWHPLIEHREDTSDAVYLVRNYSSDLANKNYLLRSLEGPYDWIIETTRSVMGDNISVDIRPLIVSSAE